MKLIRAIQIYAADNGGASKAIRKVGRLAWRLLLDQGFRRLVAEVRHTLRTRHAQALRRSQIETLQTVISSQTLTILATPHTLFVAYLLDQMMSKVGLRTTVLTSVPALGFGKELVVVVCPQMFRRLPRNMIAFQMEQSTSARWFTRKYLDTLRRSIAVFDYSTINIGNLQRMGISLGSLFYVPMGIIPSYRDYLRQRGVTLPALASRPIDVIFYGDIHNERRQRMLTELNQHFRVQVINNLFGVELYKALVQAKVVVNIHYYENALLETTRIFECLSLGIPIVSETSVDIGDYAELEERIRFVALGDAAGMVAAVRQLLSEDQTPRNLPSSNPLPPSFYLDRFLLANDLIDFDTFVARHPQPIRLSTDCVCLSLPETPERRRSFERQPLARFQVFDGLRHAEGWLGCAMSYKYLIGAAARANLQQITICEDDVVIEHPELLRTVQSYLNTLNGQWDVFVGLLTDLAADATVCQVTEHKGLTFVHLDTMTGMVLNIYNRTVYDLFESWSPAIRDRRTNTIDRFLERQGSLRVITTLPFVAGHAESTDSTLWGFANGKYTNIIQESEKRLSDKVAAFRGSRGT
jgi:hypothetical protein